jgi:cellulose synthase/poly-beta-1,6-N-acetylglucosamine synthase-like glycosyltransferase
MSDVNSCRVSFIVPARDEAACIGRCLASARRAAMANSVSFEIIVADDASADDTARIARTNGARVVSVDERHASRARNAGAAAARGHLLCFVDADTCVDAALLRGALAAVDRGAIGGGATLRFQAPVPLLGRVVECLSGTVLRWLHVPGGSFAFARRDAFAAVGGFDPWLFAAEEWALCRALAARGRTVVLGTPAETSARDFAVIRSSDVLAVAWRTFCRGPRAALRERDLFAPWYLRARH